LPLCIGVGKGDPTTLLERTAREARVANLEVKVIMSVILEGNR
jgi:hypothetical protein